MSRVPGLVHSSLAIPPPARRGSQTEVLIGARRAGALAGLVGVILYTAGVLLPGDAPAPSAATSQVVTYFVDQRGPLLAGFALQLIALAFLLAFLGQLRLLIAAAGGAGEPAATTTTSAWIMLMTIVAVAMLPSMAVVWRGADLTTPDVVRLAYDIQTLGTYAGSATVALLSVGVPSLILWRHRLLPGWLAVLGAIEVAANLLELAGLSQPDGVLAGGYTAGIGQVGWVLWVAATSVLMASRRYSKPEAAHTASSLPGGK